MTFAVDRAGELAQVGSANDAWLRHLITVTDDVANRLGNRDDAVEHQRLIDDVRDLNHRLKAQLSQRGSSPSGREARIAENELLFRRVNDRIDKLTDPWEHAVMTAVCECGHADCVAPIELRLADYHRIRSDRHFIVLPGHEIPDVEKVVHRDSAYLVVEKPMDANELANVS